MPSESHIMTTNERRRRAMTERIIVGDDPQKSGYWKQPDGTRAPNSEHQSIDDLMAVQERLQDAGGPGPAMGWIIVALESLVGDSGTTFKDIRDVRVSEDQGSFLLTDWEH